LDEEDRKRQANRKAVAIAIGVAVLTLVFLLSREQSTVFRRGAPEQGQAAKRTGQQNKESAESTPRESERAADTPKPAESSLAVPAKAATEAMNRQEPIAPVAVASRTEPDVVSSASTASPGSDGPLAGIGLNAIESRGDGQLVLDLEATELSWVVVQIDNGSPQESLLRPGEKAHWTGQDQFILTLGNAGGVKAELNGKPQKPFGPSGKVARDIVLKR
jgi:cytoskeletal protein RodZ